MAIKILVNGATGQMGQQAVVAIGDDAQLELVATPCRGEDLGEAIEASQCEVVVDLTTAACVYQNCKTIVAHGKHPVIGTTGLLAEQIIELQQDCAEQQLGGVIVPNFSIGAVMMMQTAQQIAKYYDAVEIIESHHEKKYEAPSGTAIRTAELIHQANPQIASCPTEKHILQGARGAACKQINIHSMRLPGLVAHQKVMFGGDGETLTVAHDSLHRRSFMPGLVLCCKKVQSLSELMVGLEHVL